MTNALNYKMYWQSTGHVRRLQIPVEYQYHLNERSRVLQEEYDRGTEFLFLCHPRLQRLNYFAVACEVHLRRPIPDYSQWGVSQHWRWTYLKFKYPGNRITESQTADSDDELEHLKLRELELRAKKEFPFDSWIGLSYYSPCPSDSWDNYSRCVKEVFDFGAHYFRRDQV